MQLELCTKGSKKAGGGGSLPAEVRTLAVSVVTDDPTPALPCALPLAWSVHYEQRARGSWQVRWVHRRGLFCRNSSRPAHQPGEALPESRVLFTPHFQA